MKIKGGPFECVGVVHEQDPQTFEVWTHQRHYVPQNNAIPVDATAQVPDDPLADDDMKHLFMPLVGALVWLILTMLAICLYVAYKQKQPQTKQKPSKPWCLIILSFGALDNKVSVY